VDIEHDAVQRGLERIAANLQKGVDLGKLTESTKRDTVGRVNGSTDLVDAASSADLLIEAVPERLELKAQLFRTAGPALPASAVVATNTSSLSIEALADDVPNPARFLGLHFFNPVHIMKLVEVVHGPRTAPDVLESGVRFARALGKQPIVVKDSPGFASSRLGVALGLEAMRMLEEGVATAEDIDAAMVLGYRHPMGPLKLTDLVGLDVRLGIATYLHETLGHEHFKPPAILERMVAEGQLGKKSGQGFYDWSED
jgi:3-hydroxybutyryl-CoA dehydrogenase